MYKIYIEWYNDCKPGYISFMYKIYIEWYNDCKVGVQV